MIHLFVPHLSNNQKAKILHSSSLLTIALLLAGFQMVLNLIPKALPSVLGYAANISPAEVIRLTNEKRSANGLSPLNENPTLSSAALAKGNDMLAKGYWAHFAPDGTSPWSFFQSFGYKYRYAGENLARDFASPGSAVEAWMASPTHRDNILNTNYKEVGIGVVEGALSGVDTTIIVQFFGTPQTAVATIPVAKAKEVAVSQPLNPETTLTPTLPSPSPVSIPTQYQVQIQTPSPSFVPVATSAVYFSPFVSTKSVSLIVVGILLLVLAIDVIVLRKRRIIRVGGRTFAHIAFFAMVAAVIIILKAGKVI